MPITRQFNYLPGSLAEGDKVQAEFDAIIAFINGLELNKLDAVGGNVSALHVLTTLEVDGVANFEANVEISSLGDLIIGDGSDFRCGNPTAKVVLNSGGMTFPGTGSGIDFNAIGGGNHITFSGASGGITLGVAHNIVTATSDDFGSANGLRINGGTSRLNKLELFLRGTSGAKFDVSKANLTSATLVMMAVGLPVADPGVSGQVWNNAGVLTVSP